MTLERYNPSPDVLRTSTSPYGRGEEECAALPSATHAFYHELPINMPVMNTSVPPTTI
jgi:hypothetical protein